MPKLTKILDNKPRGKVLRRLREEYLTIKPTINIGKDGVTDKLVNEIKKQLDKYKVIKVSINKNILRLTDRVELARKLQEKIGRFATIVDFRGRKAIIAQSKLIKSLEKSFRKQNQ